MVGGGSAGSGLASRLSEDSAAQVLLLEAGPNYAAVETPDALNSIDPVPLLARPDAPYWWSELKARRSRCQEPRWYWQGRGVGGSSAVNGLFAIRTVVEDHDEWARRGSSGWSFADVLPYYIALERDLDYGQAEYHGSDGPIPVTRNPVDRWSPFDQTLLEAATSVGYQWQPDHNAPLASGVSPYAFNALEGRRVSANAAYLEPARHRLNLQILGNALVDRLIFEEGTTRVVGVVAIQDGRSVEYRGDQVLLCAGAAHSPAILQRSGIGPAEQLKRVGIPIRIPLSVGESLQDHALVVVEIAVEKRGALPAPQRHANCCIRFTSQADAAESNDLMIVALNHGPGSDGRCGLGVWVNRVYSRGTVKILSADPTVEPEIDERMLEDERDLERMRAGIECLRELLAEPAFAAVAAQPISVPDASRAPELVTDTQHLSSSCPMGSADDPRAVVDPDCRVHGVSGLRVIDTSIFPDVPRANTHLATLMAAELMAARLLGRSRGASGTSPSLKRD